MYTAIGNYIRERRQDLGLSQEQLAERVGGSYCQSDVSRIERGLIELPRFSTLVRLAASLEVPVGNLLVASGWFDDDHLVARPQYVGQERPDTLEMVFAEIEAELQTIENLENEARERANRLRTMIRDLRVTSGITVSMVELEQHG